MRSNLIYVIFATVLLMAGILVAICLADTVPNAAGLAHAQFNGMQAGGDGAARLEHIGGLAFAFQSFTATANRMPRCAGRGRRAAQHRILGVYGWHFVIQLLRLVADVLWPSSLPENWGHQLFHGFSCCYGLAGIWHLARGDSADNLVHRRLSEIHLHRGR